MVGQLVASKVVVMDLISAEWMDFFVAVRMAVWKVAWMAVG